MTRAKSFILSAEAKADLRDITHYTDRQWGREQRCKYIKSLDDAFYMLGLTPSKGRKCNELKLGYLKYRVGKHIIFYYELEPKLIRIIRVLHERMNFETHLNDN